MKYTIFGFNQEQVLNMCDEHQSIDERDLMILRWIMDFYFGGMEKLKDEFPNDWNERIERLSCYAVATSRTRSGGFGPFSSKKVVAKLIQSL